MATTALDGNPVSTIGELPSVGAPAPAFTLVDTDLSEVSSEDVAGKRVILNIFPSVDTGICAASVRRFNEIAAGLENTTVLCVSKDLPFALGRFCGAEGIENVKTLSAFRSSFGEDFGVTMTTEALHGLLARSVIVIGADGKVEYTQLSPEIKQEVDYDDVIASLG